MVFMKLLNVLTLVLKCFLNPLFIQKIVFFLINLFNELLKRVHSRGLSWSLGRCSIVELRR